MSDLQKQVGEEIYYGENNHQKIPNAQTLLGSLSSSPLSSSIVEQAINDKCYGGGAISKSF